METMAELHRHSHGYPRLINTICENALIQAYARQSASVSPRIIEEIAIDFRLNVLHPSPEQRSSAEDAPLEVARAARSLLNLYEHLRNTKSRNAELNMIVGSGVSKNEPYI
jgi:hypothetical protein